MGKGAFLNDAQIKKKENREGERENVRGCEGLDLSQLATFLPLCSQPFPCIGALTLRGGTGKGQKGARKDGGW